MGPRRKLFYHAGMLHDALNGEMLHAWRVSQEVILPAEYRVVLRLAGGGEVQLWEDEDGIWLEEGGQRRRLDGGRMVLPGFEGHPYAPILRVLHQEIWSTSSTACRCPISLFTADPGCATAR
jgi:hypothetical protein